VKRLGALGLAALALGALAGCGSDKQLPPSNLPVLVPACKGGKGPALKDRVNDVTLHVLPGRKARAVQPPPSSDLLRAAVTVTKRTFCLTVKTRGGQPRSLALTARKADDDETKSFWTVALTAGGAPQYAGSGASALTEVAGSRVARRGALTELAVPLAGLSGAPFGGDFEWQLNTRHDVPGGQQIDCVTKSNYWARFPQGTTVRRPLQPGTLGPGCVP
jgi:hypothetical protein